MKKSVYYIPPSSKQGEIHTALANWLDQHHGRGWQEAELQSSHLCLFLVDDDFAALIWFSWEDYEARMLSVHICVDPAYQKTRWAGKKELNYLFALTDIIEPVPRIVWAEVTNPSVITILSLFGFKFLKSIPFAYLEF